uniref:Putative dna-directed rna polymerase iii subunit rpc7-like dufourea novaeangliae n=1 Tax=Xenopsylla cheopis TaxID=163159 RepID=A0A6M2DU16_XENCH
MAGRGRGRGPPGSTMSFTADQLSAMGLSGPALRAELNQAIHGPPLTFPPLLNKAPPVSISSVEEYLLMLKRELTDHFKESACMPLSSTVEKSATPGYSDHYAEILNMSQECIFVWKHLPLELKPAGLKKKLSVVGARKKKIIDINSRLSILEQNELEGRKRIKLEDKENEDIEGKEEEADIDQPDEEMDTGTDYVCDYFDNGEEYDDDDDNLDEPCF